MPPLILLKKRVFNLLLCKNSLLKLYNSVFSQHVERFVALTSKAAECAVGYQNRHQFILNKMAACKKVPTSARKDDFVNLVKNKDLKKLKNVKKKLCTSTDE